MISPNEVEAAANRKEDENIEFRIFLKNHADPEELDEQFAALHAAYFDNYDCSSCRNCCKGAGPNFSEQEVLNAAGAIGLSVRKFKKAYLEWDNVEGAYGLLQNPCPFFTEDNKCRIEAHKPEGCRNYPYTDQPDRWGSLYSVLSVIEVCPVAYEIWEELKRIYSFHESGRY